MNQYEVIFHEAILRDGQEKVMAVFEAFREKDPAASEIELIARTFTALFTPGAVEFKLLEFSAKPEFPINLEKAESSQE